MQTFSYHFTLSTLQFLYARLSFSLREGTVLFSIILLLQSAGWKYFARCVFHIIISVVRPCQSWVWVDWADWADWADCINYKFLNYLRQTVTVLTHASSYHVHHLHNCLYLSCISCSTLPSSHSQHYQRLLSLLCYSNFCYSPRLLLLHSVCYVVFIFNFSVYRWLTGCSVGLSLRIITSLLIITLPRPT